MTRDIKSWYVVTSTTFMYMMVFDLLDEYGGIEGMILKEIFGSHKVDFWDYDFCTSIFLVNS